MNEGTVRKWCTMFKDGQINIYKEQSGWPPVVSDDLVHRVDQKLCG
jgi:hypothetical protein